MPDADGNYGPVSPPRWVTPHPFGFGSIVYTPSGIGQTIIAEFVPNDTSGRPWPPPQNIGENPYIWAQIFLGQPVVSATREQSILPHRGTVGSMQAAAAAMKQRLPVVNRGVRPLPTTTGAAGSEIKHIAQLRRNEAIGATGMGPCIGLLILGPQGKDGIDAWAVQFSPTDAPRKTFEEIRPFLRSGSRAVIAVHPTKAYSVSWSW